MVMAICCLGTPVIYAWETGGVRGFHVILSTCEIRIESKLEELSSSRRGKSVFLGVYEASPDHLDR